MYVDKAAKKTAQMIQHQIYRYYFISSVKIYHMLILNFPLLWFLFFSHFYTSLNENSSTDASSSTYKFFCTRRIIHHIYITCNVLYLIYFIFFSLSYLYLCPLRMILDDFFFLLFSLILNSHFLLPTT